MGEIRVGCVVGLVKVQNEAAVGVCGLRPSAVSHTGIFFYYDMSVLSQMCQSRVLAASRALPHMSTHDSCLPCFTTWANREDCVGL